MRTSFFLMLYRPAWRDVCFSSQQCSKTREPIFCIMRVRIGDSIPTDCENPMTKINIEKSSSFAVECNSITDRNPQWRRSYNSILTGSITHLEVSRNCDPDRTAGCKMAFEKTRSIYRPDYFINSVKYCVYPKVTQVIIDSPLYIL